MAANVTDTAVLDHVATKKSFFSKRNQLLKNSPNNSSLIAKDGISHKDHKFSMVSLRSKLRKTNFANLDLLPINSPHTLNQLRTLK